MITRIFATLTLFCNLFSAFAQDSTKSAKQIYTGVYNQLSGDISYPVLGLVNSVDGNQKGAQIGFCNISKKNVAGFQFALTNSIGQSGSGVQLGVANVVRDSFSGVQISSINITGKKQQGAQVGAINLAQNCNGAVQVGFVNASAKETAGAQIGFVNATGKNLDGGQIGFVNAVGKNANGAQIGFVNATANDADGAQISFVNVVGEKIRGAQIGFVNVGKTISGTQVGFINFADSFSNGVPFGFLSISRKNGYYALELSANELYYYNAAFKVGVKPLYTTFGLSYNPHLMSEFAWNAGLGSMLYATQHFFFNPEANFISSIETHPQYFTQFNTTLGWTFGPVSFKAGPTFTWGHITTDDDSGIQQKGFKPDYSFYHQQIDDQNSFFIGAKAALVISFN